jgi:hypothetical protein
MTSVTGPKGSGKVETTRRRPNEGPWLDCDDPNTNWTQFSQEFVTFAALGNKCPVVAGILSTEIEIDYVDPAQPQLQGGNHPTGAQQISNANKIQLWHEEGKQVAKDRRQYTTRKLELYALILCHISTASEMKLRNDAAWDTIKNSPIETWKAS